MSLVDSDPRVRKVVASVEARPSLPLAEMMGRAVAILRAAPRVTPRSAQIIAARASLSDGRTKLVDSKLTIMEELTLLKGARSDLEEYVIDKYGSGYMLKMNARAREAAVARALTPITKRVRQLESARERIEEIVRDYDARAFAIRDTIEALKFGEREA